MAKLVSSSVVRARLNQPDEEGVNAAIASAIAASSVRFRSVFNTNTDKGEAVDVFDLRNLNPAPDGYFHLRLRNGFVRSTPDIVVSSTVGPDELASAEALETTTYRLNAEKGVLLVQSTALVSYVIQVEYEYGFNEGEVIPDWVQELMVVYIAQVLMMHQATDDKAPLTKVVATMKDMVRDIADAHLRMGPYLISPVF